MKLRTWLGPLRLGPGSGLHALAAWSGETVTTADYEADPRIPHGEEDTEAKYRLQVEHSPDLVFTTDAEGRLTYLSDACERMTGWATEGLLGEPLCAQVRRGCLGGAYVPATGSALHAGAAALPGRGRSSPGGPSDAVTAR